MGSKKKGWFNFTHTYSATDFTVSKLKECKKYQTEERKNQETKT